MCQEGSGEGLDVRELIDRSAGLLPGRENLPEHDQAWWAAYRDKVERAAHHFEDRFRDSAPTDSQ